MKALLLLLTVAAAAASAQTPEVSIGTPKARPVVGRILAPFHLEKRTVAPAKLSNTPRLEQLVRSGNLYLSAEDPRGHRIRLSALCPADAAGAGALRGARRGEFVARRRARPNRRRRARRVDRPRRPLRGLRDVGISALRRAEMARGARLRRDSDLLCRRHARHAALQPPARCDPVEPTAAAIAGLQPPAEPARALVRGRTPRHTQGGRTRCRHTFVPFRLDSAPAFWQLGIDRRRRRRKRLSRRLVAGEFGYIEVARFESPISAWVPEVCESLNRTVVILGRRR